MIHWEGMKVSNSLRILTFFINEIELDQFQHLAQWPFFIILQRIELPINLLKTALFDQCDRTGLFHQLWIKRHFYQLQGICVWNSWRKSMRFNNGRNKIVSKTWNRLFSFKCTEFHQLKLTKMTFSWLQRKKKKRKTIPKIDDIAFLPFTGSTFIVCNNFKFFYTRKVMNSFQQLGGKRLFRQSDLIAQVAALLQNLFHQIEFTVSERQK